jgi:hypothetical protein
MIGKILRLSLKLLGSAIISVILLIILLFAADYFLPWEDKKTERVFNKRLEGKIAAGEEKIYLKDLTDFEWDKVCYFEAQDETGPMQYPTPSEVLGHEYEGDVPFPSCGEFKHNDLFFIDHFDARFIKPKKCLMGNLCRTQTFRRNLHCCSREAFFQKEFDRFSNDKIGYSLNEEHPKEKNRDVDSEIHP